jgi:micrococcal nuclease
MGKVIKIVDGDTFDILTENQIIIRIRMNGIDCPERRQDYYQVCKDALGDYIFGKEVTLTTYGTDRYKRTIAEVYFGNEDINLKMITNGYAWHYKKYSSDAKMAEAEVVARNHKYGLWAMINPVAPWDFRSKKLKSKI